MYTVLIQTSEVALTVNDVSDVPEAWASGLMFMLLLACGIRVQRGREQGNAPKASMIEGRAAIARAA